MEGFISGTRSGLPHSSSSDDDPDAGGASGSSGFRRSEYCESIIHTSERSSIMIRFINHKKMGRSRLGWLDSHFHFSFAEYYNPDNLQFGVLRVINDDLIEAHTGFDTHPHQDMEIITYVVDGELTHADNMRNQRTLTRGQVQYMSAGTGITHSEHNRGIGLLRLLQIWILPDKKGYVPTYGDVSFPWEARKGRWLHMVSNDRFGDKNAPIRIHADVNIYATYLTDGKSTEFKVPSGRQAYLVLIEGEAEIAGHTLQTRDALEIVEENVTINPKAQAHVLILEMKKT